MNTTNYIYNIYYKANGNVKDVVVITQIPYVFENELHTIEIPLDDIDKVISKLHDAKGIMDSPLSNPLQLNGQQENLSPNIVETLVLLFLSGISIEHLSMQYEYSTDVIKKYLEDNGIILLG
jgi:hypothetical protein